MTTQTPATHAAVFALYRTPAAPALVVRTDTPMMTVAIPVAHDRSEDPEGIVRLGLPDDVTVDRTESGAWAVRWGGEDALITVTGGVDGIYTVERMHDGATATLVRLSVIA